MIHQIRIVWITEALKFYRDRLTAYEQSEILDHTDIWFLGAEAKKIEGVQGAAQNNGYDDENGSYTKVQNSYIMMRMGPILRYRIVI